MAKNEIILCDTTIIIQHLRGNEVAQNQLINIGQSSIALSIITHAEVYYGTSQKEKRTVKKFLESFRPIIPDALIAATAVSNGIKLFTYNRKDFDFLPEIKFYNP